MTPLDFACCCQFLKFFSHNLPYHARLFYELPLLNGLIDQKPRQIAAQILQRRNAGVDFVEEILESTLARVQLSPADRGLCQELVYGVVRWQAPLDWLIAQKTPSREQKPALQIL